jgi:hypothetical protein
MNFLLGGRLGDLIHALYVAKIHLVNITCLLPIDRDLHSDGFLHDIQRTYEELKPVIESQDYCKSFEVFNNQFIPLETDGSNLSMWRRYAYSASWTQLLANTFNVPVNGEPWIKWQKAKGWEDVIVIHASSNPHRRGYSWNVVMEMYSGRCVFVGNKQEYTAFGFNIPHYQPETLSEHFTIINSCKFFIGNQSAPLAIAHSLGVPRLAMLNEIDKLHYVGEEKFCKNYYWIAEATHHFPGLMVEA